MGFLLKTKILLVKPTWANSWEIPGGGRESNENLFDTLKREFLEETGFEIVQFKEKPFHIIKTKFYADDLGKYFDSKMYFFIINELGNQNKKLINSAEIRDLKEISLSNLNKEEIHNDHLKIFEIIKQNLK